VSHEVPPTAPSPLDRRILLLPPTRRDTEVLCHLLTGAAMSCVVCTSIEVVVQEAKHGAGAAVISEEALYLSSRLY
jgi:hypothetical protein